MIIHYFQKKKMLMVLLSPWLWGCGHVKLMNQLIQAVGISWICSLNLRSCLWRIVRKRPHDMVSCLRRRESGRWDQRQYKATRFGELFTSQRIWSLISLISLSLPDRIALPPHILGFPALPGGFFLDVEIRLALNTSKFKQKIWMEGTISVKKKCPR
jgi:hypothetical protein